MNSQHSVVKRNSSIRNAWLSCSGRARISRSKSLISARNDPLPPALRSSLGCAYQDVKVVFISNGLITGKETFTTNHLCRYKRISFVQHYQIDPWAL